MPSLRLPVENKHTRIGMRVKCLALSRTTLKLLNDYAGLRTRSKIASTFANCLL
jgi:hypothetical protein